MDMMQKRSCEQLEESEIRDNAGQINWCARLRRSLSYSGLTFAARITFPHLSVSWARSLLKSADDPGSGSLPSSAIRALIFGSARAALISLLSL